MAAMVPAAWIPPSRSRRQLLNFLTGTAVATVGGAVLYPLAGYLIPPTEGGDQGTTLVKDRFGHPIPAEQLLSEPPGTRAVVAGLAGEPTYLTLTADGIDPMALVDTCTHLGCTFPWNPAAQQFQCPCHGSLYDAQGNVLRGPAPLPLKLARAEVREGWIWLSPWLETDPRTGETPWWV